MDSISKRLNPDSQTKLLHYQKRRPKKSQWNSNRSAEKPILEFEIESEKGEKIRVWDRLCRKENTELRRGYESREIENRKKKIDILSEALRLINPILTPSASSRG